MPIGFVITEWTEDQGLAVQLKYPETQEVDLDDMMRIFYAHITGAGEAGNVIVRLEKAQSNVSSYFTGMESDIPLMINLMLELDEEPEMFGETVIREMNETILNYLLQPGEGISQKYEIIEELKEYLAKSLILLDRLKNLTKEQRMAQIYSSEKGRKILEILQDKAMSRKELQSLLEEKLNKIISNIEVTLDPFIKTGIIKQDWVEGDTDVSLFLLSDFTMLRTPAVKLIENTKTHLPTPELATKYLEEVRKFFSNYKPTFEDNLKIALNLLNPDKYDYISLFRERAYPLKKIPKGPGESFEEIGEILKPMEKDNIISFIKDKKGEVWVFLLTDIEAHMFYPEYLIEKIRRDRMLGKLKKEVAIKHLELLEEAYKK
ncbi:hypothetical protein LCGC14_2257240 [marine sediment metagenome]|uniref:Uncharacterized protein n=1 Tax=marine sediment metagenome TaxID=412755 RepID=A0A0F9FDC7_9ZZZZ